MAVVVEAIEYRPARVALFTEADTSLILQLEPDSVGIRMLAQQVQRLEARSDGVALSKRVFNREDMARAPGWTLYDLTRVQRLGNVPATQ